MAITSKDIKIYQAQDNTDEDSGGGSRTSVEVVDGDVNNLFPDISRIDTVSGDVALRKVFPTVDTTTRDVYYGAHAIIRKSPDDPNVSSLLFWTDDPHDRRTQARDRIESYVTASYKAEFYLFGNHVKGSRSVTFLKRTTDVGPEINEVYLLKEATGEEQYIRITDVDRRRVTLSYVSGSTVTDYVRDRIICEIDQPLEFAFTGSEFTPAGWVPGAAETFTTQVSDAAKFYGVRPLLNPATTGDLEIRVDGIFEALTPASRKQTPIVNAPATDSTVVTVKYSGRKVERRYVPPLASGIYIAVGQTISFGCGIEPGTFNPEKGKSIIYDDGKGFLRYSSSNNIVADIDYVEGVISFNYSGVYEDYFDSGLAEFSPVMKRTMKATWTEADRVSITNQGYNYVKTISPVPSLQNLYIDYRTGGKWYRIRLNSDNTIGEDPTIGVGTFNDNGDGTATISLTLGALPDVDTDIIYSWGSGDSFLEKTSIARTFYNVQNYVPEYASRWMEIDLGFKNIDPATFSMTFIRNNASGYGDTTATINADANGLLVDNSQLYTYNNNYTPIKGFVDLSRGKVIIEAGGFSGNYLYDAWPLSDVNLDISFSTIETVSGGPYLTSESLGTSYNAGGSGTLTLQLSNAIENGMLNRTIITITLFVPISVDEATWNVQYQPAVIHLAVNSTGQVYALGEYTVGNNTLSITGTVDLAGNISLALPGLEVKKKVTGVSSITYESSVVFPITRGRPVAVEYVASNPAATNVVARTISDTFANLVKYKIQLPPGLTGPVGFLFFNDYISTNGTDGDILYSSEKGTQVGYIDRSTGTITYNYDYVMNTRFHRYKEMSFDFYELTIDAEVVTVNDSGDGTELLLPANTLLTFRTSTTTLTPGSLQLRYKTSSSDTGTIATSDTQGVITGNFVNSVVSKVDYENGVVTVEFTTDVLIDSVKYDAVSEKIVPVDPKLLGINPVRIPVDGRVPVFRDGYHVVIFNEQSTAVTPTAGATVTLSRSGQSYVEVIDANGKRLDPDMFTADMTAGTVTFADPLNLVDKYGNALTGPYQIIDRIEDMVVATDVQVDGTIGLSASLTHDYPVQGTRVASALVFGDTGARVFNLFSQEIWNSSNPVWSDTLIGDPTTAQYDQINYPIQIDNRSSVAGRWAIIFRSSTTVDVVEEKMGVLLTGVNITNTDVAPINPATNAPYFVMPYQGFGSGWVTNNVIRFNTESGDNNMWVIRTVQPGALSQTKDSIVIENRGDAA